MTFRERQDLFLENLSFFDNWTDRFNYLINLSDEFPPECPEYLLPYRILFCKSRTYFYPFIQDNQLYVLGWSNSAVMAGLIVAMRTIFNNTSREEFQDTLIDFHTKSELIFNLTPLRLDGLNEMIRRITVLFNT